MEDLLDKGVAMNVRVRCVGAGTKETPPFAAKEGVVEVPLLLPVGQAEALEALAHARGLTAAEMVRQLLSEFILRSRQR